MQLGAITPAFYAFRDREYVLNQIEAVTGGRFHPNFDRIGGLKDDLPKGWIADTKSVHGQGPRLLRRDRGPRSSATRSSQPAPGASASSRPTSPCRTACRAPTSAPRASTGTSAATTAVGLVYDRARLEGLDPPRRRLASPASGCGSRRSARPPRSSTSCCDGMPSGPIMAKVPRIIKVPEGEACVETENPLGEMGYYIVSKGDLVPVPGEDPLGELQQRLDRAVGAAGRLRPRRHHHPRRRSTSSSETSTDDPVARPRARTRVLAGDHPPGPAGPGGPAAADRRRRLPVPLQDHVASCRAASARWRPARSAPCSCSPRSASSSRRRTSSPTNADKFVFGSRRSVVLVSTFLCSWSSPSAPTRRRRPRHRHLLRAGRVDALGHRHPHGRLGVGQQVRPARRPARRRPAHRLRAAAGARRHRRGHPGRHAEPAGHRRRPGRRRDLRRGAASATRSSSPRSSAS